MIELQTKPKDAQEFTRPLIDFDKYSVDEQIEFWKNSPGSIASMRENNPDMFNFFVDKFGQDVADEILALA